MWVLDRCQAVKDGFGGLKRGPYVHMALKLVKVGYGLVLFGYEAFLVDHGPILFNVMWVIELS